MKASWAPLLSSFVLVWCASARAQEESPWQGTWYAEVSPNEHSRLTITLALEVSGTRVRGTFGGGGRVEGSVSTAGASGTWTAAGREGGRFSLRLTSGGTRFEGDWGGEGGGRISAKRDLGARPEDCPSFILDFVLSDFEDDIHEACNAVKVSEVPYGFRGDNDDRLERFLRSHPKLIGHVPTSTAIGAACRARLQGDPRLAGISGAELPRRMAAVTAEYYVARKSLSDAIQATLENIAALDSLRSMSCEMTGPNARQLGRASNRGLLAGQRCTELGTLDVVTECDRLQSRCEQPVDHTALLERTEIAMLQAERVRARLEDGGLSGGEEKALEDMLATIEGTSAWMKGEYFQDRYEKELEKCRQTPSAGSAYCDNFRRQFICRGIRSEARQIRKALTEQLDAYNHALRCVEGSAGQSCDPRAVRETIAEAPVFRGVPLSDEELESARDSGREREVLDAIYANALFDDVECRRKMRDIDNNIEDAWTDFAVGSALTVATFGLGAAAGLARVGASAAATTARGATATARLSAMAQRGVAATRLSPRVFTMAALALDVADMSRGVAGALAECNDSFSLASTASSFETRHGTCPAAGGSDGAQLIGDYHDCVLRTLAFEAGTGLLPALPDGLSQLLDRRLLKKAEQAMDGSVALSAAKRQAVLDVFRRFKKLKESDLPESIATLKDAGFSDAQIRALLSGLAPHIREVDGRLLVGLEGELLQSMKLKGHTVCVTKVAGDIQLAACTDCGSLRALYQPDLEARPDLQRRLDDIEARLRRAEREGASASAKAALMNELKGVAGQLNQLSQSRFLRSHRLDRNVPASLRPIVDAFREGQISEAALHRIAAAVDEAHWANRKGLARRKIDERIVYARDVVRMFQSVDVDDGIDFRTRAALKARLEDALSSGSLFLGGGTVDDLLHDKLTFPRTTPELRAWVRAKGTYTNPKSGKPINFGPGDPIHADHIYPIDAILRSPRLSDFHQLPEKWQREVIYNQANLQPLPPKWNTQKSNKLAAEWHASNPDLDATYVRQLAAEQERIEDLLSRQIRCLKELSADADPARCR